MGMRNSAPWGQRRISGQLLFLDEGVVTTPVHSNVELEAAGLAGAVGKPAAIGRERGIPFDARGIEILKDFGFAGAGMVGVGQIQRESPKVTARTRAHAAVGDAAAIWRAYSMAVSIGTGPARSAPSTSSMTMAFCSMP